MTLPPPATPQTLASLQALLGAQRYRHVNELELQDGLALVMRRAGLVFERELILSPKNRIDFLIDGIGIEVKVDGGLSAVARQLQRYMAEPRITSLLLVTARSQLKHGLPSVLGGKPLACLVLRSGLT